MTQAQLRYTAVELSRRGGPEAMTLVRRTLPSPGPGEVLVRVAAAGVSLADVSIRRGSYPLPLRLPLVPGYDIVGHVVGRGEGVTAFAVGQRVAALTELNGYAEYARVRASRLVPVPAGVDSAEAVSLVLNYTTAFQMLHRSARVQREQSILVHNAAGGVGTALVQLARHAGVRVYGTASRGKQQLVAALGATPIDYQHEDFQAVLRAREPGGVDAAFEGLGQRWWASWASVKRTGSFVPYGMGTFASGPRQLYAHALGRLGLLALMNAAPRRARARFYSIPVALRFRPASVTEDLRALLELLASGEIRPVIAARLPLERVREAHALLESGETRGKIVLMN